MSARLLVYVEISSGRQLDTVTLGDGELHFATGRARDVFGDWRTRFGWSAADAYDRLTGWSNGYVAFEPR